MKKIINTYTIIIFIFLVICLCAFWYLKSNFSAVSSSSEPVSFKVEAGSTYYSIASSLKSEDLIKSETIYKAYIKISNPKKLEAGIYELNKNMNLKELVDKLDSGSNSSADVINITFKEGLNMRKIASIIASNTNNSEDDVYNLLNDKSYLDELIDKYWFIDDSIKNDKIYYSLEGYLFPDTYQFRSKDVSVKEIFTTLLDEMDKKLLEYKSDIEKSKYSVHEILTLASIVELESGNSNDRKGVAGVFYNRLKSGWSLGSDVTTYYAEKVELDERELYNSEYEKYNAYNTRSSKMAGKLPIGPICNSSLESIEAAINPANHKYYYFVADKDGKTYFNETSSGHEATIKKIKSEGKWFEY